MEPTRHANRPEAADPSVSSGVSEPKLASTISKEQIIDGFDLTFDPGDTRNGSLYLCEKQGDSGHFVTSEVLNKMRQAGIWSDSEGKQVPDEHRSAYKDQLQLLEVVEYSSDAGHFLIARFDHPKFPSEAERFNDWKQFFDARATPGADLS